MTIKIDGRGEDPDVYRWHGGLTWIAHPGERMQRASHAIVGDPDGDAPDVWVIEPVDAAGLDDLLADLGTVAGVVVTASYHRRDAATVADRHDVPVYLVEAVSGLADGIAAPVEVIDGTLPGTGLRPVPVYGGLPWHEAVLHDPETGTLAATEALATAPDLTGPGEPLAVSPYVRIRPPREALAGRSVDRILVGHGTPVLEEAEAMLAEALSTGAGEALGVWARNLPYLLRAAYVANRD